MKKKKFIHMVLLFLLTVTIVASIYVKRSFRPAYFEEILFYFGNSVEDSDSSLYTDTALACIPIVILLFTLMYALLYDITFGKVKSRFYPIKIVNNHKKIFTGIIAVIAIISLSSCIRLFEYVLYSNNDSKFIEEKYINPKETNIEFDEKRNLILIFVESLETSFFTKEEGGHWDYAVTPELSKLIDEDDTISFYSKEKAKGMRMLTGASWTTGSVITNTNGIPFKLIVNKNTNNSTNILNGSYGLGDLLKDNGYYNELISSANTSFGGIKEYYTKHGNYEIIDPETLEKYDLKSTEKDKGKWGFTDKYLFDTAKKRLEIISKNGQPFNLNLITIDTHVKDGFAGDYTVNKYDTQYENVYATESKLIYDFVNWVRGQDFYENTTIVIVGDHLSMQRDFFRKRKIKKEDRYVYNCIINPTTKTDNNSNRITTALDTYPTIVAAIGGKIEGDKIGLGVNLFSNKKTLVEKYGIDYLDNELQKKSNFYNNKILSDK